MNVRIFQLHRRSAYVFDRILDKYNFDISKGVVAIAVGSSPTEVRNHPSRYHRAVPSHP